jgi:hypothetical protein
MDNSSRAGNQPLALPVRSGTTRMSEARQVELAANSQKTDALDDLIQLDRTRFKGLI